VEAYEIEICSGALKDVPNARLGSCIFDDKVNELVRCEEADDLGVERWDRRELPGQSSDCAARRAR